MHTLQQWWSQTPGGTKVLAAGVVGLVVALSLLLARQMAGPAMEPLFDQPLDAAHRGRIIAYLKSQGVPHETEGGRLRVPAEERPKVLAGLRVQQLLPGEHPGGFASLTTHKPAWYLSNEQNRQVYHLALQEELSRVVRGYRGVRSATVIVSQPQAVGFGATHRRPTASVSVEMASGALDPRTVDAIAALVSGSVAEMRPQDVAVIDATAGRQFKARGEEDAPAALSHELQQGLEQAYREKIVRALSYIEGAIVAVNVEVDLVRRQTDSQFVDPAGSIELRVSERTEQVGVPGEQQPLIWRPGVRDAAYERAERHFQPAVSRTHEIASHPGGAPARVSATVNVPRSFFPSAGSALEIDEQLARIRRQIEPLVLSRLPGQVVVDVYPDLRPVSKAAAPAEASTSTTGLAQSAGLDPWLVVLGLLALAMLALGLRTPAAPRVAADSARPAAELGEDELVSRLPDAVQPQAIEEIAGVEDGSADVIRQVDDYLAGRWAQSASPDLELLDELDETTVRAVIGEVDRGQLVLALWLSGEEFRRKVLRNLPSDEARRVRRDLETMNPAPLSQIEHAQRTIFELASRYQAIGMAA